MGGTDLSVPPCVAVGRPLFVRFFIILPQEIEQIGRDVALAYRDVPVTVKLAHQICAFGARLGVSAEFLAGRPDEFEHTASGVRTLVVHDPSQSMHT